MKILSPIWLTKAETARRVKQRIGVVMDWAKATGFCTGENPVDGVQQGLPKQKRQDNHFAAADF
ncbi:MAG: integrase, partial [Rhodospirillaceae bacterium]|nr:integrase [Rhodospirillaceae bacterium]